MTVSSARKPVMRIRDACGCSARTFGKNSQPRHLGHTLIGDDRSKLAAGYLCQSSVRRTAARDGVSLPGDLFAEDVEDSRVVNHEQDRAFGKLIVFSRGRTPRRCARPDGRSNQPHAPLPRTADQVLSVFPSCRAKVSAQIAATDRRLAQAKLVELTAQKEALDEAHEALGENFEHSLGLCHRLISTFYPLIGTRTKAVVEICRQMAAAGGFTGEEKHVLVTSAWLHDIGLVGVKHDILQKLFHRPEDCSPADWATIREHLDLRADTGGVRGSADYRRGNDPCAPRTLRRERLSRPAGRDGNPVDGALPAVAAGFVDTGLSKEKAGEMLAKQSGTAFDPEAVRLFFAATSIAQLPRQVSELLLDDLRPGMRLAKGHLQPGGPAADR